MGLDQYVNKRRKTENSEVQYWRKENAIQGYFEDKFNIDNLGEVTLTNEIVDDLIKNLKAKTVEPVGGCFYGSTEPLEDEWYIDMINSWNNIRKQMNDEPESEFYYTCWY